MTMEELYKENNIRTFSEHSIYNWMDALGFKFNARKKTYYVDGHKKPETVKY